MSCNSNISCADYIPSGSFDPKDCFSRFYPRHDENEEEEEGNAFQVSKSDETGYSSIRLTPVKGVNEIWGDKELSVSSGYLSYDYLKPEPLPEKNLRIERWLEDMPETPALKPEESTLMPPPQPAETRTQANLKKRRILTPKRRFDTTRGNVNPTVFDVEETPEFTRSPWDSDQSSRRSAGVKRGHAESEQGDTLECGELRDNHFESRSWRGSRSTSSRSAPSRHADSECGEPAPNHHRRVRLAPPLEEDSKSETRREKRLARFKNDLETLSGTNSKIQIRQEHSTRTCSDISIQYWTPPQSPSNGRRQPRSSSTGRSNIDGRRRRPIIIDGCNLAFGITNGKYFDSKGIQVCVDYFLDRGFRDITVVVPEHKLRHRGCDNPHILREFEKQGLLITCWTKDLPGGKRVSSYDDRMIVEIAHKRGGIIISNDKFRDLIEERPDWTCTIVHRVIPFRFMPGKPDEIMFPSDPFGRNGPTLRELLRF